jgi:hypothetical protein
MELSVLDASPAPVDESSIRKWPEAVELLSVREHSGSFLLVTDEERHSKCAAVG